ncbi:MAG: hypothetical protein OIF35_04410, partial [Cellvibrionaceae bacterium]|nr:hypothetical protein [Cellvibrionaceae bacterium]
MLAHMALGLIVLALAVLPFGRYTEIPLALLTFVGVYLLISRRVSFTSSPVKYYSWAFLLFFVPMLVALPDAVNFSKSLTTTLGSLRYYFA